MRIAFVSYWCCPLTRVGVMRAGGMNIYVINFANALGNLGHKIDIYTRVHGELDEHIVSLHKNVRIIHLKSDKIENIDYFIARVSSYIRKNHLIYDILHAHYYFSGLVSLKLKEILQVPGVITFHSLGETKELYTGIKDRFRIEAEKKIVREINGIIVSTELEKTDLVTLYKAKKDKISTVSPGVNHHVFKPRNRLLTRIKLSLPLKLKIILFVGRIDPIKGISLLIEAIADLTGKYPSFTRNYRVLLVGGDIESKIFWMHPEVKKIKKLIMDRELECCVKFLGSRPHSLLPYYYAASDLVVAPSAYESFGMAALEAMSCGVCVLASRVGGLKYLINDRVNGRLFESGNRNDMAEKLWELLADKTQRARLAQKAYETSRNFCWDIQARRMLDIYRKFI